MVLYGFRWFKLVGLLLLGLALLPGCGSGLVPVYGQVTYEDGVPVEEGTVIGEALIDSRPMMVQGDLGKGGRFEWGTYRPKDGALPGSYKVMVIPRTLSEAESSKGVTPAVHKKYSSFESSGISFEVKGNGNVLNIKVSKGAVEQN